MNDFLTSSGSRRTALILATALTLAALLVVAVVLNLTGGDGETSAGTVAQPAVTTTPTSVATTPSTTPTAATAPLKLPAATKRVSGVAIGYPLSTAGAVAAAIEFTAASANLDPDRAAAVGRLIADPSWTTAPEDFAAGSVSSRKRLGLPVSGELGSDASIAVEPAQYQARDVRSEHVLVLLLSYLTTTSPTQGSQTRAIVLPCPMHWTGTDWRLEKAAEADYSDLQATPGTSQAAKAGWLDFRR